MKKVLFFMVAITLSFMSCESLTRGAISGAFGAALDGPSYSGSGTSSGDFSGSGSSAARAPLAADFQTGDMLVSEASGSVIGATFSVARVLTPASTQTKNQAEVIYVGNGEKAWVNYVIPSRKAERDEFKVGMEVFYLSGWADHDEISNDNYRKSRWVLGRVTSTEELYKNRVEIDGDAYAWMYVRVPTVKVK